MARRETCVNCGERIEWAATNWLHVDTGRHECIPTTFADPGT